MPLQMFILPRPPFHYFQCHSRAAIFPLHLIPLAHALSSLCISFAYSARPHRYNAHASMTHHSTTCTHTTFSITTPTQHISLQIFILTRPPFHSVQCLSLPTIVPLAHALSSQCISFAYPARPHRFTACDSMKHHTTPHLSHNIFIPL